ncbi:hypothetical protein VE04_02253 [Pseudogymnoascus sp. 24MN13]|nr:hypothetical protein VE04_02253 [Pseudogymnoascus sp. 24MN13]
MAKSKALKGVSVSIIVNGTKAIEHEAPADETPHKHPSKTVLRYIEAISGTNYSILTEVSSEYKLKSSLEFQVRVDGWMLSVPRIFVRNEDTGGWTCAFDGKEEVDYKGRQWKKSFKFSPLKIVDVHDRGRVKKDANAAKHIGEIRVTVVRKQVFEETYGKAWGVVDNANLEIAEKAVKGQTLSHGTEFEEAVQYIERTRTVDTKPQRGSRDPAAVFIFRYRSREALEAEHIIPRAQSSNILGRFTAEELRAARELWLEEEQTNSMKIKKEAGANDVDPDKFSNDYETLTVDITGDEEVEIWKRKPPKERVDLSDN